MLFNPSPPSLDVYPANPAMTPLAYGGSREMFITVRCRVSNADSEGGQDLLLSMMDPEATTSVAAALLSDPKLGGKCDDLSVDGPSGYGTFPPDGSNLLGCTWDVRILPS